MQRPDDNFAFEGVVGNCPKMNAVLKLLKSVAPTNANVLILGETGTGKELVAKAIHTNSLRKENQYSPMNCTAINEQLFESELFGHEKGSFTGADKRRIGKFEQCNGGTLFLDEIGDMPLSLQAKMLRVLQDQTFERVGGSETIKTDVRLIAATHRDLEKAIAAGQFRMDLYQRLKVVVLRIPPLRARREDVPVLATHFMKTLAKKHGKEVTSIATPVWRLMEEHSWPGNVRELENVIASMVVLDTDGILSLDDVQEGDALYLPSMDYHTMVLRSDSEEGATAELDKRFRQKANSQTWEQEELEPFPVVPLRGRTASSSQGAGGELPAIPVQPKTPSPASEPVQTTSAETDPIDGLALVRRLHGDAVSFPRDRKQLRGCLKEVKRAASQLILKYLEACAEAKMREDDNEIDMSGTYSLLTGKSAPEINEVRSFLAAIFGACVGDDKEREVLGDDKGRESLEPIRRSQSLAELAKKVGTSRGKKVMEPLLKYLVEGEQTPTDSREDLEEGSSG